MYLLSFITSSVSETSPALRRELVSRFREQTGRWCYIDRQIHGKLLEKSWRRNQSATTKQQKYHGVTLYYMLEE